VKDDLNNNKKNFRQFSIPQQEVTKKKHEDKINDEKQKVSFNVLICQEFFLNQIKIKFYFP